jgi:hypothetical protein
MVNSARTSAPADVVCITIINISQSRKNFSNINHQSAIVKPIYGAWSKITSNKIPWLGLILIPMKFSTRKRYSKIAGMRQSILKNPGLNTIEKILSLCSPKSGPEQMK